ncbi:MAG: hypothetical protein JWO79_3947 [Actinomycetia bacterium]|nr:hypothetical protein [Actinomycetes bacterium]
MHARRILAAAAFGPIMFAALALGASPASAHGALDIPNSRTAECGEPGNPQLQSTACQAAVQANGGAPFAFDNLRVPDVNGRDRQVIPDGQLCSGGLPAFRGLDVVRADWPTTTLTSGAKFTFRYPSTIPHEGSFRLYVSTDSYDPSQPLTWADIEQKPFLVADNPPLTNGAYRFRGTLPAGKAGRAMIYAIWQTTSTPDTYYSCADVVFTAPAARPPAAPRPQAPAAPVVPPPAAEQSPVPQLPDPEATGVIEAQPPAVAPVAPQSPPDLAPQPDPSSVAVSTVSVDRPNVLGTSLLVGAIAAALALGVLLAVRQYRSRRG